MVPLWSLGILHIGPSNLAIWQQEFKLPTRVRNNLVGYTISTERSAAGDDDGNLCGGRGEGGALLKAELAAKALEGCKIMMVFRQASTLSKCTITLQAWWVASSLASVVLGVRRSWIMQPQPTLTQCIHPLSISNQPPPLWLSSLGCGWPTLVTYLINPPTLVTCLINPPTSTSLGRLPIYLEWL